MGWNSHDNRIESLPFFENEENRADDHSKTDQGIPLEFFLKIDNRKNTKNDERDHFLYRFELRGGELPVAQTVCRHLETIFKECDQPTHHDHNEQRRALILEVPVPRNGHKNIRNDQQNDRGHGLLD